MNSNGPAWHDGSCPFQHARKTHLTQLAAVPLHVYLLGGSCLLVIQPSPVSAVILSLLASYMGPALSVLCWESAHEKPEWGVP